jgi:hypothetical protein
MDDLVTVEVQTKVGDSYMFPYVMRSMLSNAITFGAWEQVDNIVLVNTLGGCLSIPKATVTQLRIGEEVVWPSSNA